MKRDQASRALADLVAGKDAELHGIDRAHFLRLIDTHRVAPWLLARHRSAALPAWLREALAKRAAAMQAVGMLDEYHRREVLGALTEAGLEVIPLKGAVLGPWLYGRTDLRPANDLDVLVPTDDLERATDVLKELGYVPAHRDRGVHSERASHEHAYWRQTDLPVELHTHVTQPGRFRVELEELYRRSCAWNWNGLHLRRFSLEDQLLTLVVHAAHHQFLVPLISWVDLQLLLDQKPDMHELARRADRWRMTGALYGAAMLLERLLGDGRLQAVAEPPGPVRRRALVPLLTAELAQADTRGRALDRWGAFWLIDRMRDRLGFAAAWLARQTADRMAAGTAMQTREGQANRTAATDRSSRVPRQGVAR